MRKSDELDYSRLPHYIFIAAAGIALLALNWFYFDNHASSNSEVINNYSLRDEDMNKTRVPAVAGLFYPADVYQLSSVVDGYLSQASSALTPRPHMMVVPHAGYQYSAAVAAAAYKKLLPFQNEIKKVILIGPSHRVALRGAALSSAASFSTPLGSVPTDAAITAGLARLPGFDYNDRAHAEEHSLEVQLPFLQKVLGKKFTIVPLVYGLADPADLAAALSPYLARNDTLLVFSADLSHYLDYTTAKAVDGLTADMVGRKQALESHQSCGATGINTALLLAKQYAFQPRLLDMANSGDVTGERDSVVGYASWIFDKKDQPEKPLTPLEQEVENLRFFAKHYGTKLMQIAETALNLAVKDKRQFEPSRGDFDDILFNKGAAFVTLTENGGLRGCIGTLVAKQAIARDIAANAYAAAMEDSRFEPVTEAELPGLKISISLLTGYEPLVYADEEDLLNQLQPGVDGLVIRDGDRQALFLPSVWAQLPDKRDFLNNLKLKAGFSPSFWSNQIKAYRFRTVEIKQHED